ncbi:hypothetical protein C942_03568 [Photobacterium marinum]|uniref:histidine kinase n=1 Tax=Photobacterium marinum TaxID=1056511 RepID=L8J7V4_9GAMM|nr:ATP-binding protein [Photobacterium marinum]ELR63552.1 hypothetical protein C942_03568 [Photobacterium marinum]
MKITVRSQLIIFATLITCVVVTGVIVYTLYFGKIHKLSAYTNNSLHTNNVLAHSIVNPLYFSDLKSLKNQMSYALFNPNMMCAVIRDASYSIIAEASQSGFADCPEDVYQLSGEFQTKVPAIVRNDDGLFIWQVIMMPNNELVGYLLVGFTLEHIEQSISNDLRAYLLLTVLSLIIALLFAYMFSRFFSQPLTHMVQVSQDIGRGVLNSRVTAMRNDEIGDLCNAINTMAENLKKVTVSKDYLNTVINSLGEMLFVIDNKLNVRQVNAQVIDVLGYSQEELQVKSLPSLFASADFAMIADNEILDYLESDVIEITLQSKLNKVVPILLSTCQLSSEKEGLHGYVCIARDITERKLAEEQLQQYNTELTLSNQALKIAQDQLIHSAKMASMGEITAGLAHEINQPLGAIQLNAELIQVIATEEENINPEELAEIYNKIHRQINRIKRIVQHLKTFSRDDKVVEFNETDVVGLIEDSLVLFLQRFRLNKIKLIKDISLDMPKVECNRIQIEQVLTNLLTNAEHAVANSVEKVIQLRAYSKDGYIAIDVEDNGCGIPDEHLNKIFDPFFTTKQVGEGTGLGMSISYGIVQSHKGKLTVRSKLNKGTIFTLLLPIKQNHQIQSDEVVRLQGESR